MSKKQWLALLALYALYLLFGAFVFQALEADHARDEKVAQVISQRNLQRKAIDALMSVPESSQSVLLELISAAELEYGTTILPSLDNASALDSLQTRVYENYLNTTYDDDIIVDHNWDLWNTFFFTFITITTIGYGHMSPRTVMGQQFCVLYSLFGIPLNTLVFVALAGFYSEHVLTEEDRAGGGGRSPSALVCRAVLYLIPGVIMFLVVPAIVVMFVEEWTFLESFYFAFISLTTIGFGDFVAGHPSHYGGWDVVYKAYIMLWTMFGLGYIIMVVTFLIDAFKSKHVLKVEKKTRKVLQKRTARLQKIVQSFVLEHEAEHRMEGNTKVDNVQTNDQGRDNEGFAESESPTADKKTPCNHANVLAEVSKPSRRRTSIVEILGKMFHEPPPLQRRRMSLPMRKSSVPAIRRPSIQIDREGRMCCKELQALVDLVAAVEDLVDHADEIDDQEMETDQSKTPADVFKTDNETINRVNNRSNKHDTESVDLTVHM